MICKPENETVMKNEVILFILITWLICSVAQAQVSISTGQADPHPSAALDVSFSNKGFLPPRMTHRGMDSIPNPATGLIVYCSDCGTGGTGCLAIFLNGGWHSIETGCIVPLAPVQGSHVIAGTSIIWNWLQVPGATGYKWGSSDNYANATDIGNVTTRTESGLNCNTFYVRYVWAYNDCGNSSPVTLSATTLTCTWSCGQSITDSRDGKTYGTVLIGSQCWMSQNLNTGTRISGNTNQTNNTTIEKYCYNDQDASCTTYGGLYQWAETVQYLNGATNTTTWSPPPAGNVQGICPSGWHLPTYQELVSMLTSVTFPAGGSLKETGTAHWNAPNTGATNSSGYNGLPAGYRYEDGTFMNIGNHGQHWSVTEGPVTDAAGNLLLTYNTADAEVVVSHKPNGFSVRCIKNQ